METADQRPRLHCIIVTYKRPVSFERALDFVASQDCPPRQTIVVDNHRTAAIRHIVDRHRASGMAVTLLTPGENLGPAGGTAVAMAEILRTADDGDWITRVDDDNTVEDPTIFARLLTFAVEESRDDSRIGAVGAVGARFDWHRGRLVRITDDEIRAGPVSVDYVPTNLFPAFSVRAVRDVGVFDSDLFFGSSELEYGLRLRRSGYRLLADSELWTRLGRRWAGVAGPSRTLGAYDWRRYYSLRNQLHVLMEAGHPWTAVRVALIRGLAKPMANLVRTPLHALVHLRWNLQAILDAALGRMGRTYDPEEVPRHRPRVTTPADREQPFGS